MKPRIILLLWALSLFVFTCEKNEDTEPDRTNVTIQFENNSGDPDKICYVLNSEFYPVVFIVSYRDIQADINLGPNGTGFLVVNVEDGEEINIIVQGQDDDRIVSNANVSVRTDSRPVSLEGKPRIVEFCEIFDLQFYSF